MPDALRDAAADLPFEQERVHHRADIVDDMVAKDLDLAGLGVDFEFADMHAVREILVAGGIGGARDETGLHALGQAFRVPRLGGDAAQRNGPVGAGDREDAVGEVDIGLGGFEQMRGDRFRLLDDAVGRHQHGRAAQRRRARAAGALAERDLVGIALDVGDLIGVEAEPVAHQLLEDGLVPHALGDRAA